MLDMATVAVGMQIGYARSTSYGWQDTGVGVVSKINGRGQIVLANGLVFNKHGQGLEACRASQLYLVAAVDIATHLAEKAVADACTTAATALRDGVDVAMRRPLHACAGWASLFSCATCLWYDLLVGELAAELGLLEDWALTAASPALARRYGLRW